AGCPRAGRPTGWARTVRQPCPMLPRRRAAAGTGLWSRSPPWETAAMTALPQGFSAHVAAIGIKDDTDDFLVLAAERTTTAAAVFNRSRFAGPSVTLSRAHVANGRLRAVVVVSKNANVATGEQGQRDAAELAAGVAAALGCPQEDVLVASTGVIGRPYPMDRVRKQLEILALPFTIDQ